MKNFILIFLIVFSANKTFGASLGGDVPTIESLGLRVFHVDRPQSEDVQAIRTQAANIILKTYHQMNNVGRFRQLTDDNTYESPYIPGGNWSVAKIKTSSWCLSVCLPKIDHSIKDALDQVYSANQMILECQNASVIARIALGQNFAPDYIKKGNSAKFLQQCSDKDRERKSQMEGLLFQELNTSSIIETGDFVYIYGHPNYKNISTGPDDGQNLFMVGYDENNLRCYIGFGDFFKEGPKTGEEIQEELTRAYLKAANLPYENIKNTDGFKRVRPIKPSRRLLNIERILELQQKPSRIF